MSNISHIPQWGRFERSFLSTLTYTNPLQEATLEVIFVSPTGKRQTVPGFWDGDTVWRVRFAPDETGEWTYTSSCSDTENTGLHNQSGSLVCGAPSGGTCFDQYGPLRLSDNRRFLVHADGTPFFWLADTAWNGPLRSTPAEWEHYLRERTRQKFTAVQWVTTQWISAPDGDLTGELPFTGHERIAVNPAAFQRLDAKLDALNQAGLLGVPVLLWAAEWSTPEVNNLNPGLTLPEDQCILLARYMVARWHAHDVVWILPGDGVYTGPKAERWQRIGRAVFGDTPQALVTLHPSGMQWNIVEFQNETWWNIIGYQSCHFGDDQSLLWLVTGPPATEWGSPPRPIINLEPSYEGHIDIAQVLTHGPPFDDVDWDKFDRFDAHAVRRAMYWSLLVSPTAGVSYGGHGVWGWDDGTKPPVNHPMTGVPLPWQQALTMPAAEQIAHLADLFGSIEWWRLRPAPELVAVQPGEISPRRHIAASRSDEGDLAVVYVPEDRHVELFLEELKADLTARWFNPRMGERIPVNHLTIEGIVQLDTPALGDWVLLLE